MPTVLRAGPYRFFFYSGDGGEPAHIHIERDNCEVKVWLEPVRAEWSHGFRPKELNRILALVEDNQRELVERWHEFFHGK
jgi:hypothetical protein